MAQPPTQGLMSRSLARSIPFITPFTFVGALPNPADAAVAEFDTLQGFADPNLFDNAAAFPGGAATIKAVGPYLDALVFGDGATLLRVEFAVDRGAAYRQIVPDTVIPASTAQNISGLRITGRYVRVSLINNAAGAVNVEFGVYVRSV